MSPAGFKPVILASERQQTPALERSTIGIRVINHTVLKSVFVTNL